MASPIRLSVVTETYPPEMNGVALSLRHMIQGLIGLKHHVQVIRPSRDYKWFQTNQFKIDLDAVNMYEEHLIPAIPVPQYPELNMGWPAVLFLSQIWRARRPDVIHIATEGPLGWAALFVGRRYRIPISSDFRTNFHDYSKHYGLGYLRSAIFNSLRYSHNNTDCTLVPTHTLKNALIENGFHNVRVVTRGVDTAVFDPAHRSQMLRSSWGAQDSTLVLLYVGRVAAEKNLTTLMEAFFRVRMTQHDVKLVIVGGGPQIELMKGLCKEAVFTGPLSGSQLSQHYASADIFVFPSLTETYGNVTAEALASGLPVVAFSKGASTTLIKSGINGIRVEGFGEEEFVNAVNEIVSKTHNLQKMKVAARRSALSLSWARVATQFEEELIKIRRLQCSLAKA